MLADLPTRRLETSSCSWIMLSAVGGYIIARRWAASSISFYCAFELPFAFVLSRTIGYYSYYG